MALEVWPLGVFVVFVMMWLLRRLAVHLHSRMVGDMAVRACLLDLLQCKLSNRNFFTCFCYAACPLQACSERLLGQAKGLIILDSRHQKLERHGMETKFPHYRTVHKKCNVNPKLVANR